MGNRALIDQHLILLPGDIVFVRGRGLLSRLIRIFSRRIGESRTEVNHVGLITAQGNMDMALITEARTRVKTRRIKDAYGLRGDSLAIYRPAHIPIVKRHAIARRAILSFQNLPYGWGKIILHALDGALNGIYLFRRLGFLPRRPICSFLVSSVFNDVGETFGVSPWAAQPDDIWDYVVNSDNWKEIRPLRPYHG